MSSEATTHSPVAAGTRLEGAEYCAASAPQTNKELPSSAVPGNAEPNMVFMSPAPPNVHINGLLASPGSRIAMRGFDPSQLLVLQQVDGQGNVTTSPAVTAMDALKLGLFPSTPLMSVSPVARLGGTNTGLLTHTGTPMASYTAAAGPADWSQHYLQIANLQNLTTGFLSPAGQPLNPNPMIANAWASGPGTPGGVMAIHSTPTSLPHNQTPLDHVTTPTKQSDPEPGSDGTHDTSEKASDNPTNVGTLSSATHPEETGSAPGPGNNSWINVANGYGFPGVPFNVAAIPTHMLPSANLLLNSGSQQDVKLVDEATTSIFPSSIHEFGSTGSPNTVKPDGRLVDTVLHAKSLTEQMLREFSVEGAADVLRTALSLLGRPQIVAGEGTDAHTTNGELANELPASAVGALPSVKLVHPDEFKNASTFLKIYGDPLCFTKNGPLPKKGRNGNWECSKCSNVNFPRRFRCNMCSTTRDEDGDRVVSEYARQVYERYLYIYRNQQAQGSGVQQIVVDRDSLIEQPPNSQPISLLQSYASCNNSSMSLSNLPQTGGCRNNLVSSYYYTQPGPGSHPSSRNASRSFGGSANQRSARYARSAQYDQCQGTYAGAYAANNGAPSAQQYQSQSAPLNHYPRQQEYAPYY